jgi:large subunit ribosomal protein L13
MIDMNNRTHSFNEAEVDKKWYVIDAAGKVLGRMGNEIAKVLQGKHKPQYTPHADTGDYVVVINAEKVYLSGKKPDIKVYRHHSGYIGGLKEISYQKMADEKPEEIIIHAVKGMMPKSKLGRKMMSKLKVYAGPDHPHTAQQPELLEL